jgi:hypothetical protein
MRPPQNALADPLLDEKGQIGSAGVTLAVEHVGVKAVFAGGGGSRCSAACIMTTDGRLRMPDQ